MVHVNKLHLGEREHPLPLPSSLILLVLLRLYLPLTLPPITVPLHHNTPTTLEPVPRLSELSDTATSAILASPFQLTCPGAPSPSSNLSARVRASHRACRGHSRTSSSTMTKKRRAHYASRSSISRTRDSVPVSAGIR